MNITSFSFAILLAGAGTAMSATEMDRLEALCKEQERQIRQLEEKIALLTNAAPPSSLPTTAESVPSNSGHQDPKPSSTVSTYIVKSGDSMDRIARSNGISVAALTNLNSLKEGAIIYPGQKLKLPGKANMASGQASHPHSSRTHTVVSGDTFFKIASKYGVSMEDLIAANPGVKHKALRIGQSIQIHRAGAEIAEVEIPAPTPAPAPKAPVPSLESNASIPILNNAPAQKLRTSDRPVLIEKEITYGKFAADHGTTPRRLDELNGLELDPATVLAKGSELYIPAQP